MQRSEISMGKKKPKSIKLPTRDQVTDKDTWDLGSLFSGDEPWERAYTKLERKIPKYVPFRGHLADDAKTLLACLKLDLEVDRLAERLGTYAFLKSAEDQANSTYQRMLGRFQNLMTRSSEASSFIRPELMAVPDGRMKKLMADRKLAPIRLLIRRMRRYGKHTLSKKEERLLALQGEMAQASSKIFRQLLDSDMQFGPIKDETGDSIEMTNATWIKLLQSPKRAVRRRAFHQYYRQFRLHENTLAAALSGSVQKDVYYAKIRGFDSSLHAALFPDNVPKAVYENLIATVRSRLPVVHRYYDIRRRKMRLKEIHHYDTYVPILADLQSRRTWKQAADTVVKSLQPLGTQYCDVLAGGLHGRWCDRYPNRGKQSGAFSCGSFDGDPYILMNYKPDVLDDMFTLTHEAGHSMHSWYSAKHQPYAYYDYTIFVAEVASTFNEQLLSHYLTERAKGKDQRAYLVNRDIDAIRGTIIRQTMFAEFEECIHRQVESGEPLTLEAAKGVYGGLLRDYFGPDFAIDEVLELECLRIPHFYRAFYVYKYATGLSAGIALSRRVLEGGKQELDDYLRFLKAGCSQFPLEILRGAGVDMQEPQPIEKALDHFEHLVDQLDELL
jgi:oligoendopeptidase F